MREVVASLWALAVSIEDGNITDVDKALRAAQDALKDALERGASDEEIKKLTENLRAALDKYLQQLAEQMRNNPQQLARPLDRNSRVMRPQDLDNMIERMERLSRSGDKDAAKQLLEQLQQMLENLQMAQPGQGQGENGDMQQSLNELGDMIRKQQQLRDKTYKQGQDSRRDRRPDNGQGDHNADERPAAGSAGAARQTWETAAGTCQAGHGAGPAWPAGAGAGSGAAKMVSVKPIPPWVMPTDGLATAMPMALSMRKAGRWTRCAKGAQSLAEAMKQGGEGDGQAEMVRAVRPAVGKAAAIRPTRWGVRCMAGNSAMI